MLELTEKVIIGFLFYLIIVCFSERFFLADHDFSSAFSGTSLLSVYCHAYHCTLKKCSLLKIENN